MNYKHMTFLSVLFGAALPAAAPELFEHTWIVLSMATLYLSYKWFSQPPPPPPVRYTLDDALAIVHEIPDRDDLDAIGHRMIVEKDARDELTWRNSWLETTPYAKHIRPIDRKRHVLRCLREGYGTLPGNEPALDIFTEKIIGLGDMSYLTVDQVQVLLYNAMRMEKATLTSMPMVLPGRFPTNWWRLCMEFIEEYEPMPPAKREN